MKKILYLFIIFVLHTKLSYSQTPPVAVNDTFYVNTFNDSIKISRTNLSNNDYDAESNTIIVDTVIYNGTQQFLPTYFTGALSWIRLKEFTYKWTVNHFGLDSLTYVITDNGNPTGFDTATIYIQVIRKNYENIDLNNIKARVNTDLLFNNKKEGKSSFECPKGSNHHSIYAANLWIAGEGINGDKYGYYPTYGELGVLGVYRSISSGPVRDSMYGFGYDEKWARVWKVNQSDIDHHLLNYSNIGYNPIEVIANWPAHGDTTNGEAYYLAPFVDVDMDGIYNPLNGDYPKIKGQQAIYFINNSMQSWYGDGSDIPMGLEIHGMAYVYGCPSDSAINNTIFLNYKLYNRSSRNYQNIYTGFWADIDIGNSNDDFIGCDVPRGAFYGYNGDVNDEDANGVLGYGVFPAAQSVVFLKGPQKNNDGMDNPLTNNIPDALSSDGIPYAGLGVGYGDGIVDNEYLGMEHFVYYNIGSQVNGNGDPFNVLDVYNYLQGKWTNGNNIVWGGDGNPISTGTGNDAKYMFPGNTDPLFWGTTGIPQTPATWNEASVGNTPGDRRGVGSTGSFNLNSGDYEEIDLALVFGRDYQNSGTIAGITVMQERIDSIRSYYLNDFQSVCGGTLTSIENELKQESELKVYPNPFKEQVTIYYELQNKTAKLRVFNIYGQVVKQQLLNQKQTVVDLSNQSNGIYFVQIIDGKNRLVKKMIKNN